MKGPGIIVSRVVAAPLETVWGSWADFGGIYKFHDDVRRTTILTEATRRGVGAVRLCELADGKNEIEERIVEWEPMKKLGVKFNRTCLPVAYARADFLFETYRSDQTRIELRFSFTPRGLLFRIMKPALKRKMRRGFEQLLLSNQRFVEAC